MSVDIVRAMTDGQGAVDGLMAWRLGDGSRSRVEACRRRARCGEGEEGRIRWEDGRMVREPFVKHVAQRRRGERWEERRAEREESEAKG
jgi:hypothetical protein